MGLISFLLDCVIISSVCAGARRTIGLNVGQKVVGMVKNETGQVVAKGFFNTGEWVVDKSVNYARNKIFQHKLNEFKDFTNKPPTPPTNTSNTYPHQYHQQQNNNQYMPNQNQQQQNNNNSNNNNSGPFRH